MKRKVKHISGKKHGEKFTYEISGIRYRDAKGRISKFSKHKRLRVEVLYKFKHKGKMKIRRLKKYSLPLRKRAKPVTKEETIERIKGRKKRGEWKTVYDGTKFESP